ncbi:MAG: hypothetical protein M3O15_04345 [Acidobacteriota bacterium]|nr:hypothetical protein [Acidobacteriota bacterium]
MVEAWHISADNAFETARRFVTQEQKRLAVSRLRGWGQWASLDPLAPEERVPIVIGDKHYHHWGLYKALLDASRWYGRTDPREAADIVSLAITVAELLDPASVGGPKAAIDLQAMAWAILGNARRLAADLEGAREALNEAWRLNSEGTGDPLEKAQIISFDASYVRMMGEFETAESILGEALTIYIASRDFHMQGRILLQMGDAIGHANPERGIGHIRHALELINTSREPRLELCAQHDLAWFLNDAGRSEEALAVLDRARRLYKQFPDEWTQLRLQWVQGRIARGMGQLSESAHIFRQVAEELRVRDLNYDLLMVLIDLAETMVVSGERASASRLVAEFYPIMATWNLHRYALAAWLFLQQAIEEQQKLDTLFSRLRLYFHRTWHKPAEFVNE